MEDFCLFTDGNTNEILESIPSLNIPIANSSLINKRIIIVGGSICGLTTAACLKKAGFNNIKVFERNEKMISGAGIGLDDASIGILKGLNVLNNTLNPSKLQRMRWSEERLSNGTVLVKQPFPYSSILYNELKQGLMNVTKDHLKLGSKALNIEKLNNDSINVHFENGDIENCDIFIAADGPRSIFRKEITLSSSSNSNDLRFAGYCAWRGTIHESSIDKNVMMNLKIKYPNLSNCLYFIQEPINKQHAVLYDIGDGLINWLIYKNCEKPVAEAGHTTLSHNNDINTLYSDSILWDDAFKSLILATPNPFQTDIYDLNEPLKSFCNGNIAILGDAAHAITPHLAKGSNLAIHDAYVLACVASKTNNSIDMLKEFSNKRVQVCAQSIKFSRYMGCLRNGLLSNINQPINKDNFERYVLNSNLPTCLIPQDDLFKTIWEYMKLNLTMDKRGFNLINNNNSLEIKTINHVAIETKNVDLLVKFYTNILGLKRLFRTNFGFNGAWFQLSNGMQLHIIESDPQKPIEFLSYKEISPNKDNIPEKYIRRSQHIALTVDDIEKTKEILTNNGIEFAIAFVPDTNIVQLFIYDPDGNGVEVGNFDNNLHDKSSINNNKNNSLEIKTINHVAIETKNVDLLVKFYTNILGLKRLFRPNFGFNGAWFQLSNGIALHIIESDPQKPLESNLRLNDVSLFNKKDNIPEKYIRRSQHIALTVDDIEKTKEILTNNGIEFAIAFVPDTNIVQLFIYDPDGNGVEVGNFDVGLTNVNFIDNNISYKSLINIKSHIKFYSSWFCPYAQRVWMLLEELKLDYELIEINPYESSNEKGNYTKKSLSLEEKALRYPDWIKASPRGLVPALSFDNETVCDSMVCLEFLDELCKDNNNSSLLTNDIIQRAKIRYWSIYINEKIIPFYYKMLMSPDEPSRQVAKSKIIIGLSEFSNAMCTNGIFFLESQLTLIDLVLFPWYERLLTVCVAYRNFIIPETNEFIRLNKWYLALSSRQSIIKTLANKDELIANYSGYADNSATSDVAVLFR